MPNATIPTAAELAQTTLATLRQWSETSLSSFGNALPAGNGSAEIAGQAKAALDSARQFGDLGSNVMTDLFYAQLRQMNLSVCGTALTELSDTNADLISSLVQKQTSLMSDLTKLYAGFLTELQGTRNFTDISMLQSSFMDQVQARMKTGTNDIGQLLMSAQTAASAWTDRTLDNTINGGAPTEG
ncbi:MAG: hypothetical protein RJA44_2441 [Pseudomonadota bacterium]